MKCEHELCNVEIEKNEDSRCGAYGSLKDEGCSKHFCDSHLAIDGQHLFNGGSYKAPQLCPQCSIGEINVN